MALSGISANRLELLQIADAVAREKSIEKEIVIEAIEEAIQKAARTRYGAEHDIRVHIDTKTGETTITRVVTVVDDEPQKNEEGEDIEVNDYAQKRLADALLDDKDAEVGKILGPALPAERVAGAIDDLVEVYLRERRDVIYENLRDLQFEYRLGNRSALEWVIDQYQVSTDKRSGITNDPNRADDPQYILRLIGQVVTVSLETVKIVRSLPPLGLPQ